MSTNSLVTIFAFLIHTDRGFAGGRSGNKVFFLEDRRTSLAKLVRERTGLVDAQVIVFDETEWRPPRLKSLQQNEVTRNLGKIQKAMHNVLRAHGVPPDNLPRLTDGIDGAPNPITGELLMWVIYRGKIVPFGETQKPGWQFWRR